MFKKPDTSSKTHIFAVGIFYLSILLFSGIHIFALDGNVDASFRAGVLSLGEARAVAVQPDGKILVGGKILGADGLPSKPIVRFNADGSLDPTFDPPHIIGTSTGTIYSITLQPDGKIIVGGGTIILNGRQRSGVYRLNADGSSDDVFNSGVGVTGNGTVFCTALQPDGKILIGGDFDEYNNMYRRGIARINPDGSVDTGFSPLVYGDSGNAGVHSIGLQGNKIIIAGDFTNINEIFKRGIARLNMDGSPDTAFTVNFSSTGFFIIRNVLVLPDNRIMLCGNFNQINTVVKNKIARLNADGSLDNTFAADVPFAINAVWNVKRQADGKYLIFGFFNQVNGTPKNNLARLNTNGSLDSTFTAASDGSVYDLAATANPVFVGAFTKVNGADAFGVSRVTASGTTDPTFSAGIGLNGIVRKLKTQPDGKLLVGGEFLQAANSSRNGIVRMNADGSLDTSFAPGTGIGTTSGYRVNDMAVSGDMKIAVVGNFLTFNNSNQRLIVLLNPDGSMDNIFNAGFTQSGDIKKAAFYPGNKILIAGSFRFGSETQFTNLALLNADGTRDTSFMPVFSSTAINAVAVQPDGKIIVGGGFTTVNGVPKNRIVRFNANGSIDESFNINAPNYNINSVSDIVILPDGKLLIGGSFQRTGNPSPYALVLLRLNSDGSRDEGFNLPEGKNFSDQFAVQSDGRILLFLSESINGGFSRYAVVRLRSNGSFDHSFKRNSAGINQSDSLYTITVLNNNKIVAGGKFIAYDNIPRLSIVGLENSLLPPRSIFDFDGDGKTDIGIFRPSAGEWWITRSSTNQTFAVQFGTSSDKTVPADFTGDGRADIAFWRESTGEWFILRSEDNSFYAFPFGQLSDIPAPGDFDADGKADAAVFRPSNAAWYILRSSDGGVTSQQFGVAEDLPVVADYDGDGKDDIAIFRPSVSQWWLLRSTAGLKAVQFGATGDKTVQGDYTGDGKADIAFWRPSTGDWYILRSEDDSFYAFPFGTINDIAAPGDYDGDGRSDAAVFRPSNTVWYQQRTTGGFTAIQFGTTGDQPIPNSFVRN